LLRLPGQLGGELLLLDFTNFSTIRLKAPRRSACAAPACALIHGIAAEEKIEVALPSLGAAADRFEVIDIRNDDELAAFPAAGRHIAMPTLLADPGLLSPTGRYLLVCASGKRSLATARHLRSRGLDVHSLAGGLNNYTRLTPP
jgi:adenylyltransferase/sulfurtransferase